MQHVVVVFSNAFDQLRAEGFCFLQQLGGNLLDLVLGAERLVVPHDRLHGNQVDYTFELCFLSDGDLYGYGTGIQALADGIDGVLKISAHLVHLVDEADAGNAVLIGLAPNGFRLRFHAMHGVKHGHGAVEDAQRTLHFSGKVYVTRSINNVDADVAPDTGSGSGRNRNAALLLLLHPVHGGGPMRWVMPV